MNEKLKELLSKRGELAKQRLDAYKRMNTKDIDRLKTEYLSIDAEIKKVNREDL